MARPRINQEIRNRVNELYRSGKHSRREVAEMVGVSPATVSTIVKEFGGGFDRTETLEKATEIKRADNKHRRQELLEKMFINAHKAADAMWTPYKTQQMDAKGNWNEVVMDHPPAKEQQYYQDIVAKAFYASVKADQEDNDAGLGNTKSMLGELGKQLSVYATQNNTEIHHHYDEPPTIEGEVIEGGTE